MVLQIIRSVEEYNECFQEDKIVVVCFLSEKNTDFALFLSELNLSLKQEVTFALVDVDEFASLEDYKGCGEIPYLKIFKNRTLLHSMGSKDRNEIKVSIEKYK